jgi:hypothetical protein
MITNQVERWAQGPGKRSGIEPGQVAPATLAVCCPPLGPAEMPLVRSPFAVGARFGGIQLTRFCTDLKASAKVRCIEYTD